MTGYNLENRRVRKLRPVTPRVHAHCMTNPDKQKKKSTPRYPNRPMTV